MVVAVLATTAVYTVLVERFSRANAVSTAASALTQIAWQMRDQLDRGMSDCYEDIRVLAGLRELRPGARADDVREFLNEIPVSYPRLAWVGYVDAQGLVLASNDGLLEGKSVSARPWFAGALKGTFVGDVHAAVLLEKLLPKQDEPWRFVDVAVPISDKSGAVRNVLGVHLSWEWARELRRTLLEPAAQNYGAEIFVVSRNGDVLLGPKGTEGKKVGFSGYGAMLDGRALDPVQVWDDGVPYATAVVQTKGYGRYPGLGWVVVARQPKQIAFAEYLHLQRELIAGAVLTALIAVLCAPWVARRLTGPLTTLASVLEKRAQGDMLPFPKSAAYREAELLSNALTEFTEREHRHLDQLREANENLERRIESRTAEIRQREHELRAIIEQTDEAFIRINALGEVVEWNNHAQETFGWRRDEALGMVLSSLIIPADLRGAHHAGLQRYLSSGQGKIVDRRIELPALRKDGEIIQIEMVVSATQHNGQTTFNAFLHDIGERKRAETELLESRERLQAITDNVPALIAEVDRSLCYRFANQAYRDWFDIDPKALLGQHMSCLYGDQALADWAPHLEKVWQGQRVQFERTRIVGSQTRYELATYLPHRGADGEVAGFYALVSDQTLSKELELRLQNEAVHDALTGLPNRRYLMEKLPKAMARADRSKQPMALLFLDLNGFKGVNDTHGHDAGDELLQQVAHRLQGLVRKTDTVVRLAGDEFVIAVEPLTNGQHDASMVAGKIDEAIAQPFSLTQAVVQISVSTGISMYEPGSLLGVDELLSKADSAMYAAKKSRAR